MSDGLVIQRRLYRVLRGIGGTPPRERLPPIGVLEYDLKTFQPSNDAQHWSFNQLNLYLLAWVGAYQSAAILPGKQEALFLLHLWYLVMRARKSFLYRRITPEEYAEILDEFGNRMWDLTETGHFGSYFLPSEIAAPNEEADTPSVYDDRFDPNMSLGDDEGKRLAETYLDFKSEADEEDFIASLSDQTINNAYDEVDVPDKDTRLLLLKNDHLWAVFNAKFATTHVEHHQNYLLEQLMNIMIVYIAKMPSDDIPSTVESIVSFCTTYILNMTE
jgi:hypothetical protein